MKHIQRGAALLTVLALLITLTLPAAAASDTVMISTVQDFIRFSKRCTQDTWSQGLTVELTADLDLSGDFTPVPIFQGTFHGNGHTISGLSFAEKGSKTGLFRTLTQSAVVENLTVEGTLEPQGSASQAGLLAGENYGTIRSCVAQGSVEAQEDVGGLVGLNGTEGRLLSCRNEAGVSGVTNVGGIAGQNLGWIEGCINSASVNIQADQETPTSVGGVAGLSRGTIRSCTNAGAVGYQHVGYNMGGIVGLQSGEVSGCANTGPVKGRKDVGGIVGQFEPYTSLTYGDSPSQRLTDSLAALFDRLEDFTSQLNTMVAQGLTDARSVQSSLSAVQDRVYAAGTEGVGDFRAMSDSLYQYTTQISKSLDQLREDLGNFGDDAGDALQETLDQSDALLEALQKLAAQGDSGLGDAIHALERTVSAIHTQLQTLQDHRQAMIQELDALKQYLADVAQLIRSGQFEQALQLPFPSLDPVGHMNVITQVLKTISSLAARLPGEWADIYDQTSQAVGQAGRDMDRALDRLYRALTDLNEAGSAFADKAQDSLEEVSRGSDQIRALLKEYTDTLGEKAQSAVDDIHHELNAIQDQMDSITQAAKEDNDALYASSQAIMDQMEQVRQAISGLGEEPELTVTDLTDEESQGPGLVMNCTASGTVEGDSNVGGIVGTVSAELGDDPEATFDLGDLKLMSDVYATLRALVRQCRFDGAVTVKNECGGGVAGRCEAGVILDCAARGSIETGGDYCGGIAGRTRGKVIRCAALTDLTGQSWLGGVTGLGQDISNCRTMVRADSDGEYQGAIAGQAEGTLTENCYLMEDLAGLDGVDYSGIAQGLDFASFSQLEGIPADFLTFSYRFVVHDQTIAEIPFSYGEDLDMSQVPETPEQDGQYGQWPQFPTQNLRRSMVLKAQFTSPTATLADQEGVAQLLVEGTFAPDACLTVEQVRLPDWKAEGYNALAAWSYAVTGSQEDTVTVRLRAEDTKRPGAAVYENGQWRLVNSTLEGSYLIFSAPAQGQVLLLDAGAPFPWLWVLGAGGAALLLGAWFVSRKKWHRKAEENSTADV
ncbi:hypothetical protein ACTQ4E_05340 [Lawsonibacter sp. LCP25S3_G6]|uniref:hypothetical protein n=1 Tax=unclassified Lawsonibacter TaxID=2617946 RepID=UPI003F978582